MDDIAACIKDHQYNEAIKKTVIDPEESLARAILEEIPLPSKKDEENLIPEDEFAQKVTFEEVQGSALGRHFLCECILLQESNKFSESQLISLQDTLNIHSEYRSVSGPVKTEAESLLAKFESLETKIGKLIDIGGVIKDTKEVIASTSDIAKSDSDPPGLEDVFSPIIDVINEKLFKPAFEDFKKHETFPIRYRNVSFYSKKPVSMDDFVVFRELGRGAFGVVSGARHRVTGQMVALKGMNRKLIKGKKVIKMVQVEHRVLKTLSKKVSPFCVSLRYSFMDSTDLFLGLPLCTGGDLMYHLRSNRKGYGVERARFFAAEILCAMEHMHNLGILYRDLKPENVLLDEKGHCKISDMGLAVLTKYTPLTIGEKLMTGRAGTPGYWPPEMIEKKGYAFDADWWSYGVQLYEFLSGICCFSESLSGCKDRNEATLTWEITFPEKAGDDPFPESAKDLILKLLDRDRTKRLGAKPDAVTQIKNHPFFESVDWVKLRTGTTTPPWVPPADAINAASQEELQEKNKEHEFKKLKLDESDNIEGIDHSSHFHEQDLVTVLRLEKKGKLLHLKRNSSSSACSIL